MTNIRNLYITFKVTLKCNLACKYCYGRENNSIGAEMSDAEIRSGLQFAYRYALAVGAKNLMICWHGGEPLLLSKRLPGIIVQFGDPASQHILKILTYRCTALYTDKAVPENLPCQRVMLLYS